MIQSQKICILRLSNKVLDGHIIYLVDGLENTTSLTFEIDKPYTVQRDDAEEITVCSKGNSSTPHSQDVENVLLYTTEVPIKVIMCVWSLLDNVRNLLLWSLCNFTGLEDWKSFCIHRWRDNSSSTKLS